MSATDTIKEKIRKLLAVASCEAASNPEKATALHQAARLAARHAIDLDALGSEASDFGSVKLCDFGNRTPCWCVPIMMVLSENFNVCTYRESSPENKQRGRYVAWHAFGCRPSREVSVYVYTYLRREFVRLAAETRPVKRSSYFHSLASGLICALHDLRKAVPREESAALIQITDRLTTEFSSASAGFGKCRTPLITLDRDAFNRGRQIEINPGIRTKERKAIGE